MKGIGRENHVLKHEQLTNAIIGAFYHVYNVLGFGFLEKVYENALAHELQNRGHHVVVQYPIAVWYDGVRVGEYFADMVVDRTVIVELKTEARISSAHAAQLTNYLKATHIEVGLVLNFGPRPEVKRRVFSPVASTTDASSDPLQSA